MAEPLLCRICGLPIRPDQVRFGSNETGWEHMAGDCNRPALPSLPDRFGVVFPDGAVFDMTESARLFDQDPEERARLVATRIAGTPVRIRTELVALDG